MSDRREAAAPPPGAAHGVTPPAPASDERVLLLECRLEQMRVALSAARRDADQARQKLAEAHAREAEHARRHWTLHEELAEARSEVAAVHRRLEQSEALRAEIAGYLFEADGRGDSEELVRLRLRALAEDQRALVQERTLSRLRERVEELVASRETLLTRVAEWQQLIREDGPEAADLSEFLAELRREILDLEHREGVGHARELELRARLAEAGVDPDAHASTGMPEVADIVPASMAATGHPHADEPDEVSAVTAPTHLEHAVRGAESDQAHSEDLVELSASAPPERHREIAGDAANGANAPPVSARTPSTARMGPPPVRSGPGSDLVEGTDSETRPTVPPLPRPSRPALERSSPGRPGATTLVDELLAARSSTARSDLLLRMGRSGEPRLTHAILPWTDSGDASVRAAAYEALGRLLERDPSSLEPHLRKGLSDPEPRVRRRVALASATARGLDARALLDPLREDPDPQVRRVVREVLRQAPRPATGPAPVRPEGSAAREDAPAALAAQTSAPNRSPRG